MKRVMCVYLPGWSLQRLAQEQPALRSKAVALVDSTAPRGPRVVLASRRAAQAGVRPGMPLAEALALDPRLAVHEQDAQADLRGLLQLAKTAERYSPVVALEEGPTPQGLFLDIAGSAGCFGGEEKLLERARHDLEKAGWTARLAVAGTVGASWGLSRHAVSPCLVAPGDTEAALRPLPLAGLRLPAQTLALLAQLGLARVDDLLGLPRSDLAARFGPLLLRRLDQALGHVPEVVLPQGADPELQAGHTLDFPTERFDEVCQVLDHLAEALHHALRRRNLGARLVECRLSHESVAETTVEVGLYRPSGCPRYLGALLRARLEQVQLPAPICAVRLCVPLAEQLPEVQPAFFETDADESGLVALIDRLSNLLGRQAVTRPRCVPEAQPEYACRFDPVLEPSTAAVRVKSRRKRAPPPPACPLVARPVTVWPRPMAVEVLAAFPEGPPVRFAWEGVEYRVTRWWGPERIETGWWRGDDVARDYYVVTIQPGQRFWLYRRLDAGGWFLQGCFE